MADQTDQRPGTEAAIVVPDGLDEDGAAEFMRACIVARGGDPDTAYPLSVGDPDLSLVGHSIVTATFRYEDPVMADQKDPAEPTAPARITDKHWALLAICPRLPTDYTDYGGTVERWADDEQDYPDCSSGCRWAEWLRDPLGADWCVCTNPTSPRVGLLTFEHMAGYGCFEEEEFTPPFGVPDHTDLIIEAGSENDFADIVEREQSSEQGWPPE